MVVVRCLGQSSCVGVSAPLWRPPSGHGLYGCPLNLSLAGWGSQPAGAHARATRLWGSFPQSFHPENVGQNLEGAPLRCLEGACSIMVRCNVHIWIGQGCGQLAAFLSQISQPTAFNPHEVSERPHEGMVDLIRV